MALAVFVRGLLVASMLAAVVLPARADDASAVVFRGFGTLGATHTNSREANFVRDLSQPNGAVNRWDGRTDSLLGMQANLRFDSEWEGVVQAVSRYRYDQTYTPDISWAYLKYDPNPQLSLRAGRLGTDFFMLADSRLVGYSYLTVRPPGDFFWHLPFYSIGGADAAVSLPVGDDIVRGKVFSGISDERIALANETWKLDGSRMSGAYVDYLSGPWLLRASYASIRFKNNLPIDHTLNAYLPPDLAAQGRDYLATANTRADYYSLGLVYERGPWQVQLMLNRIEQGSKAFQNSSAGYVLAGYRIASLTPYIGYSWVDSQSRQQTLNPVVAAIMADSHSDQKTTLLGVRWDVLRNVALKLQWDAIRGEPESIFPFRRETPAWSGKMNVFSTTLDFVF